MNKIKKFSLGKLFDNNKFVFVVSLVIAFAIWLGYSMYGGEQQERTVEVPIQMDSMTVPKQFNLQQFGDYSNSAVTVTIVGKKAVIGTVTADDIKVVASTLDVNTAGKHTLPLSVSIDSAKDFQIVSTNTLTVEVYFDVYKEVSVEVTPDLSATPSVPDGYELGTVIYTSDKVLAHGPSTEVTKIDKVLVRADIDTLLTTTKTYEAKVVPVDQYGNEIQNIIIDEAEGFKVTIPVFKLATMPVGVEFSNIPDGISAEDLDITYSVDNLNIAGEAATIDKMDTVTIGTIDFSELDEEENKFEFDAASIAGIKVKSRISSILVTVSLPGIKTKDMEFSPEKAEIVNSSDKKVEIISTDAFTLTVAGLTDEVDSITSTDVVATLKVNKNVEAGKEQSAQLTLRVQNHKGFWVVGKYTVKINVSD